MKQAARRVKRLLSGTIVRLVLGFFVLQFVIATGALMLVRARMETILTADRVEQVGDARHALLATWRSGGIPALRQTLDDPDGPLGDPALFAALRGSDGDQLYGVSALGAAVPTMRAGPVSVDNDDPDDPTGLAVATRLSRDAVLVVGAKDAGSGIGIAFAEAAALTLLVTAAVAMAAALALGYVLNRRTAAIARTASALAAGNFAARVDHPGYRDGFDEVRDQINAMAERIDALVAELQTISASLAHDLRSPVARVRAALDNAWKRTSDPDAAAAIELASADAEGLDRMLAGALDLSRMESGTIADRRVLVDVAELLGDLVELYEPLAESQGVTIKADLAPAWALADRELLARAVSNLMENALKYGAGKVRCTCVSDGQAVFIAVSDDGVGIAPDDRPAALRRFSRLDHARTTPGAGLGLTMAAAVASLHGGRIELGDASGDEQPGLRVTLIVPACDPRPIEPG